MEDWNQKIGKTVFVFDYNDGSVVNFILFDNYPLANGVTVLGYADRTVYPHVVGLKTSAPIQNTRNIIQHELGHIMGLGHSENFKDLMYYASRPGVYASEGDVKLAKEIVEKLEYAHTESD